MYKCGYFMERSQYKIELDIGLYLLRIMNVHQFDVRCRLTEAPTLEPTASVLQNLPF